MPHRPTSASVGWDQGAGALDHIELLAWWGVGFRTSNRSSSALGRSRFSETVDENPVSRASSSPNRRRCRGVQPPAAGQGVARRARP